MAIGCVVRYHLNHEPVFMAGPKPMMTEFDIHQRLDSCDTVLSKVNSSFHLKVKNSK